MDTDKDHSETHLWVASYRRWKSFGVGRLQTGAPFLESVMPILCGRDHALWQGFVFRNSEACGTLHASSLMNRSRTAIFASLSFVLCAAALSAGEPGKAAQDADATYARTIEKRVADILAVLDLSDSAKSAQAHDLLVARYRALRDWHDANDPKLKNATPERAAQIKASLKAGHDEFLASLSAVLTPAQVERVKDQMTYNKVNVTYDAYFEIVPNLTEQQKQRMLELLKEAREEAMDAGSAEEKSAVFNRFKGKINNYLAAEGHDLKQAYKGWGERRKAKPTPPAQNTQK
jgi:hypothetical protein